MIYKALAVVMAALVLIGCGRGGKGSGGGDQIEIPDDVTEKTTCLLDWDLKGEPPGRLYQIAYVVYLTKAGEVFVSLTTTYKTPNASLAEQKKTLKYEASDIQKASGYIDSMQWQASLAGKIASIKRIPFNETRVVECK